MNTFENIIPSCISYLPNYEIIIENNNKFKYEIYILAKNIAIIKQIKKK